MSKNKYLVKELMSDTQNIFDRIKKKIDSRTRAAITVKLGTTTHLASVKKLNSELKLLDQEVERASRYSYLKPPSIKSIKKPFIKKRYMTPIVLKKYFVSGNVEIKTNYTYETKKRGQQKSRD